MAEPSVMFTKFLYILLNISDSIARLVDLDSIHVLDLKLFLAVVSGHGHVALVYVRYLITTLI